MDFNKLSANLLASGKQDIPDRSGLTHLLISTLNFSEVGRINFDKFNQSDIHDTLSEILSSIHRNDDYDDGNELTFISDSPVAHVYSMSHKIYLLETVPKKRVPSSFKFL